MSPPMRKYPHKVRFYFDAYSGTLWGPKYTLKNRSASDSTIALYNYISIYAYYTKKHFPLSSLQINK